MPNKKKRILVLGQTPPPYGGQALMFKTLLEGNYEHAELFHVNLAFSKDFDDMGSFKLYKLWALTKAIVLTWIYRFYYNTDTLYYGPAGPNKMAVYRDIILILPIRFLFKKTIFHMHAGGASTLYAGMNPLIKRIYRICFFNPDILIKLTNYSHGEDTILKPKKILIVPNGIKDEFPAYQRMVKQRKNDKINILYVGAMYDTRGTLELIRAAALLKQKNITFRLNLVGIFISENFKKEVEHAISAMGIEDCVSFLGTKIDDDKWRVYAETDIFCFPSYVPSETFGIVLVESMQFQIPVVAARWNGLPFVVDDGKTGLLVNPRDESDICEKLERLIRDESLRFEMGLNGRQKFIKDYSIDGFINNMDKVFSEL